MDGEGDWERVSGFLSRLVMFEYFGWGDLLLGDVSSKTETLGRYDYQYHVVQCLVA